MVESKKHRSGDLPTASDNLVGTEIAVVGMACRFPDAPDVDTFWHNLLHGVESVRPFAEEDLRARGVSDDLLANPNYVSSGVVLDDIDQFDAGFFGFSPRDASIMDPQHRIFLECAWEALEHAGYDPGQVDCAIGVYGGCGMNGYMMYNLLSNPDLMASSGEFLVRHTGNDKDFLTTRVSYELDLKGPSVNVQTACSTSLVAVHMAIQSLLTGECDMALAGGVTINLDQEKGYLFLPGEIMSPDGHCRSFDAESKGTIFGSGVGLVVLKRMSEAIEDSDTVHGVLLGSAVNNDGRRKVGYMAPSVDGQAAVIAEALSVAGVKPRDISYVEAHGTGTPVGDPIEVVALTQVHRNTSDDVGYCGLGSVKSNIGHLDTAAGVAGLIKTIQALKHRQIPPTLHFKAPNPGLEIETSPFFVVDRAMPWKSTGGLPRRAGVSSLGVGGTNAHVVLEEAPTPALSGSSRPYQLVCISARTETAVQHAIKRLADCAQANPDLQSADVAYTLHVGRKPFAHRRFAVVAAHESLGDALRDPSTVSGGIAPPEGAQVAFMFAGGGAQHPGMGSDLYDSEPVYRGVVDEGLEILRDREDLDLHSVLFPDHAESAVREMERPSIGLPALFVTQMALARQLGHWGIVPDAVIGHSVGEYAAACISGVIGLEDALRLVALRGRLFEDLPKGGMLSVALAEDQLLGYLNDDLGIAAVNGTELCVVSGPVGALDDLEARLEAGDVDTARVKIRVAAHSSMVEEMLEPYCRFVSSLRLHPPSVRFASNLSGTWLTAEEAVSPEHWAKNVRMTVRFDDGLKTLLDEPNRVLVEIGPGRALSSLARQHALRKPTQPVISTMRHPHESSNDQQVLLNALGQAWSHGIDVDWKAYYGEEKRRRIPLPTYPFERRRYWIEPGNVVFSEGASSESDETPVERRNDVAEWFEVPVWKPIERFAGKPVSGRWLIVHDGEARATAVIDALRTEGAEVATVEIGATINRVDERVVCVRANVLDDFEQLIFSLEHSLGLPEHVLFLEFGQRAADETNTFYAVLNLMRVLGAVDPEISLELNLVTHDSQAVLDGDSVLNPSGALLLGPVRVVPREFPNVRTHFIDVETGVTAEAIVEAIRTSGGEDVGIEALRNEQLYGLHYESIRFNEASAPHTAIKENGAYLITGGFGGIGLSLARHLASLGPVRLALLGRSPLSPKAARIVRELEERGVDVVSLQADVADQSQMTDAVAKIRTRFGHLDGVFHTAGVLSDRPLLLKSAEDISHVLAPKVNGSRVIDEVLRADPPDFVVLFSSTSAVLGLAGQIDYAAANAFMNSFAAHMRANGPVRAVAVNWGIWRDVGMAAQLEETHQDVRFDVECTEPVVHGLLSKMATLDSGERLFAGELQTDCHWVVDEHRLVSGQALLPGTAFLELAYTALKETVEGGSAVELSNVTFLSALTVQDRQPTSFRILLIPDEKGYTFKVASEQGGSWVEHAVGSGVALKLDGPQLDVKQVLARCVEGDEWYDEAHPRRQQMDFLSVGERWSCVKRVTLGQNEVVAILELSDAFASDLEEFNLHPAVFDMATGVGLDLVPDDVPAGLFVPLVYDRVRAWERIPQKFFSCVQLRDYSATGHVAKFDVQLCTDEGRVCVEIVGLTMKLVNAEEVKDIGQRVRQKAHGAGPLNELIELGIRVDEGMEALERILSADAGHEVVATPVSLKALANVFSADAHPRGDNSSVTRQVTGDGVASPATPRDEIEAEIVSLWEDLLGAQSVGIHDNFFDLGGHSLLAVRLFARLERQFEKALPLAALFEAPTPAKLAHLVRGGPVDDGLRLSVNGTGEASALAGTGSEFLVTIQPGNDQTTPFFCVHGAGGNVLNFRDLAVRIGSRQPFYGLQARGVDGRRSPHETIEEMAEAYLREIRTVQPRGPYLLGGYSGGGVVAFEMARQLESVGEEVALLVFIDTFRPGIADEEGLRGRGVNISRVIDRGPGYIVEWAKRRFEFEKWRRTRRQMEELIRKGKPLPLEMREIQMTAAYHRAANRYQLHPLKFANITLFTAGDRAAEHEQIEDNLGWKPFAGGGMDIHFVPGDHDSLMREPNVKTLAAKLRLCVENAQGMFTTVESASR